MKNMTKEELKRRYDYFCSPVDPDKIIKKEEWENMTPEEKKNVRTPMKI